MEEKVESLETLQMLAHKLVSRLTPIETATLITLSGELGAGKTTFSQMVGKELGVTENMVSPTFVLEKVYALTDTRGFTHLIHIDAYRLQTGDELGALRLSELLENPQNIILLEWPEKVADSLPLATIAVTLEVHEGGTRTYNEVYA
jgi:tRNA threonylcarbamoyladenosine biosynthesis protein TsaE